MPMARNFTPTTYFQNPEMPRAALARYAHLASVKGERGWSIAKSKLDLHRGHNSSVGTY
jgi:hypothetical protein